MNCESVMEGKLATNALRCDAFIPIALGGGGRDAILGFVLFLATGYGLHSYWRGWRGFFCGVISADGAVVIG